MANLSNAAERILVFSGTLEGEGNCVPTSDEFCGPYRGVIKIEDAQVGSELFPFSYLYTASVEIRFADGQTASCLASPVPLPIPPTSRSQEEGDAYARASEFYCEIMVNNAPRSRVQISASPLEPELSKFTLLYSFDEETIDVADLSQVLDRLMRPADHAVF